MFSFLDPGRGCMSEFALWTFIEMSFYNLNTFLYIYNSSINTFI